MDRSTRASDAAPPPTTTPPGAPDAARPAGRGRPRPRATARRPRDTAASAAAEEEHTTGLTGAPDPATTAPTRRPPGTGPQWEEARRQHGRLARVRSIDPAVVPPGVRAAAAWAWRIVAIATRRLRRAHRHLPDPGGDHPAGDRAAAGRAAAAAGRGAVQARRAARARDRDHAAVRGSSGSGCCSTWSIDQFRDGLGDLTSQVNGGIDKIQDWLINGPLGLSQQQIDDAVNNARESLTNNRSRLTSGALGAAGTIGEIITGALLTFFATIFFIKDGRQIWTWVVRLFPRGSRERIAGAGERAWRTLISYVHATLAVAFVDAIGIGVGAAILGVPLALPLAVIVFLGSFIPIVGATLSGLIAVLVALVAKGPVTALILLGIVLLVQQVEGHILQPLLLGRAVKVHPLAIVFGIATGTLLAGIIGALLAVPIVAVIATVSNYLSEGETELVPLEPADQDTPGDTAPAA